MRRSLKAAHSGGITNKKNLPGNFYLQAFRNCSENICNLNLPIKINTSKQFVFLNAALNNTVL